MKVSIKSITFWLKRPYPLQKGFTKKAATAATFGVFVFLFLFLFEPFGIANLGQFLFPVTLGYGATTFAVMLFLNAGILAAFPAFADESSWTLGKELLWTVLNILAITFANLLYSTQIYQIELNLSGFLIFGGYTIGVGIFPTMIGLMYSEMRLRTKFEKDSNQLNKEIELHHLPEPEIEQVLEINSENSKENLQINHADLVYIRAAENYIDVYFLQKNKLEKRVLRNTLSAAAEQLAHKQNLMRCHKSFLVNLHFVNHVSGNAQGYKLHLQHTEELIPVSRQHNQTLHQRLAVAP